jgi:hypothetical protein
VFVTIPGDLAALLDTVNDALRPSDASGTAGALVIIDDLSALSWCFSNVIPWVTSLRAICAKKHAALVSLFHADATSAVTQGMALDATDEDLFRSLLYTADLWVSVKQLASGRAADCDGEIAVHQLARSVAAEHTPGLENFRLTRAYGAANPCLYRVAPGTLGSRHSVRIWARGTGQGLV